VRDCQCVRGQAALQAVVDELRPKASKWDEIEAELVRRENEAAVPQERERIAAAEVQCNPEAEDAERKREAEAGVCLMQCELSEAEDAEQQRRVTEVGVMFGPLFTRVCRFSASCRLSQAARCCLKSIMTCAVRLPAS
jgi:hypothetical protein